MELVLTEPYLRSTVLVVMEAQTEDFKTKVV